MTGLEGSARSGRWVLAGAILVALVVAPFALFGVAFEAWTGALIRSDRRAAAAAFVGVGLLAADVVLPVPSSLVSAGLGAALGPLAGTLTSTLGMTLGSVVGYGLGRAAGAGGAQR